MTGMRNILIFAVAWVLCSTCAAWGADDSALRRPPRGSVARQRLLKLKLQRITAGSLSAALDHNRRQWERITPDQRQQYRRSFLAFLQKSPEQQDKLLAHYEKLFKMSPERRQAYRRRSKWLRVVVKSFTAAQREELERMAPGARARKILARKAQLLSRGRLKADRATTAASGAPTSRPAGQ